MISQNLKNVQLINQAISLLQLYKNNVTREIHSCIFIMILFTKDKLYKQLMYSRTGE